MMFRKIKYASLIYMFFFLFLLGSCVKMELEDIKKIVEGAPATINLSFVVESTTVQTRLASPPKSEDKINNLYIIVFNEDDTKASSHYFDEDELHGTDLGLKPVTIATLSGVKKTAFGIVNFGTASVGLTKEELDKIENIAQLNKIVVSLSQTTTARGAEFVMSGYLRDTKEATLPKEFDIETGMNNGGHIIFFNRLDAKVTFKIELGPGVAGTTKDIAFDAQSWKVFNCSKSSNLFPTENTSIISAEEVFDTKENILEGADETGDLRKTFTFYLYANNQKLGLESGQLITGISDTGTSMAPLSVPQQYALRTKRIKTAITPEPGVNDPKFENGNFEYANHYSTYVKIKGNISYLRADAPLIAGGESEWRHMSGPVEYTILLGGINDENGTSLVNNYETKSNVHYTYTITVNSANNIIVEAETNKDIKFEDQPAAEGTISDSKQLITFDSHYDSEVITFDGSYIGESTMWTSTSPFETEVFLASDVNRRPKDYEWLYFRLNEIEAGGYSTSLAKYPGDAKSMIFKPTDAEYNNLNNDHFYHENTYNNEENLKKLVIDFVAASKTENNLLVDIGTLTRLLRGNSLFTAAEPSPLSLGDVVTFTAFAKEYYYDENPLDGTKLIDGKELTWKDFVNKPDRAISIPRQVTQSPDGNSKLSEAEIVFRQKAIQTPYSLTALGLHRAWGTETLEEGVPELPPTGNSHIRALGTEGLNGRKNMLNFLMGLKTWDTFSPTEKWDNFIDYKTYKIISPYENAHYACMTRNRDLNGNKSIELNEVRWYLAGIDQLTGLWIGENSIHTNARLYKNREGFSRHVGSWSSWREELYMSSTVGSSTVGNIPSGYFQVLWAAEGSSVSAHGPIDTNGGGIITNKFFYRCLRDLGTEVNDTISIPQDLVTKTKTEDPNLKRPGYFIYDVSFLEEHSLRSYVTYNELPIHNERTLHNLPRKRFELMPMPSEEPRPMPTPPNKPIPSISYYSTWSKIMATTSPCPKDAVDEEGNPIQWRIPNQRELAIIYSRFVPEEWHIKNVAVKANAIAGSSFSLNSVLVDGIRPERPGFSINVDIGFPATLRLVLDGDDDCFVRCVRDLE